MRILIACEESGIVRDAFIARGHDAISCDLLPTRRPGPHISSKKTGLWLKGLPFLKPTKLIPGRLVEWPKGSGKIVERWANQTDSGQNRLTPGPTRARDRSETYAGIAAAMAEQWGNL